MEKDLNLYWKHFKVWIFGGLASFIIASATGILLRRSDPDWAIPIVFAVLFFPLILHGAYGLQHKYSMAWRYGYIYRGTIAKFLNLVDFVIYLGIVIAVLLIGGRNFN